MSDAAAKMERQDRILAEFSELGLSLGRRLHEQAMAAETPADLQAMALGFQRISRSVRQTIGLELKVERARRGFDRDERHETKVANEAATTRRKKQVQGTVEQMIWTEREGAEAEQLVDHLDDLLEIDSLDESFLDGPVDTLIARLRYDLGLAAEALGEAAPDLAVEPVPPDSQSGSETGPSAYEPDWGPETPAGQVAGVSSG